MSSSAASSSASPCKTCNGAGQRPHWRGDGTMQTCSDCDGRGYFDAPDFKAILQAIQGRKRVISPLLGREIKTLRAKRPDDGRAYYVWRMTRFHSGADVCMPVVASWEVSGDPYREDLDEFAAGFAVVLTGKGSIGTQRWAHAMYGIEPTNPEILNMPTHDSSKPFAEMPEAM